MSTTNFCATLNVASRLCQGDLCGQLRGGGIMFWLTYLFEWMRCFSHLLTQEITRLLSSQWPYTQAYVNASSRSSHCQARRILALCLEECRLRREEEG